jgi:integrase
MTGKVLRLEMWPEADKAAWAGAFAEGDIFDGQGPAAHWAASSRRSVASGYGRWIGYLTTLEPEALNVAPAERVTRERLRRYLDHLSAGITPAGVFNYAKHLYDALRVMAPEQNWDWLKAIVWRLEGQGQSRRHKAPRMVTPSQLIELGLGLMDRADREPDRLNGAIAYRDGLVIALLTCRPIRRRNLAMIEIGRHLVRAGSRWHLSFAAGETKNRQPYEAVLPGFLAPYVERYLAEFRPRFPAAEDHEGLWASAKGCPITEGTLYVAVRARTKAAFGKAINLHLFRDIAATQIAYSAPASIGIARDLLGHGDLRSIDRHYNQASQIEAGRAYQGALLADRSELIRGRRKNIDRR